MGRLAGREGRIVDAARKRSDRFIVFPAGLTATRNFSMNSCVDSRSGGASSTAIRARAFDRKFF